MKTENKRRVTICVDVGSKSEIKKMEQWFRKWNPQLSYVSGNVGCGCCIRAFCIEGPAEAIDEIPKLVISPAG